jgi:hypothetical protein
MFRALAVKLAPSYLHTWFLTELWPYHSQTFSLILDINSFWKRCSAAGTHSSKKPNLSNSLLQVIGQLIRVWLATKKPWSTITYYIHRYFPVEMSGRGDQLKCSVEVSSWNVQLKCPVEMSSWNVQLKCPVEMSGRGVQLKCSVELSSWNVLLICPVEMSSWNVQLKCPVEVSSWNVRSNCPVEMSSWNVQLKCPVEMSGRGVQLNCTK